MNAQITYTLINGQKERFETLRTTNMAGNRAEEEKTEQELMFQLINAGLTAIEQQRKQYQRAKLGRKISHMLEDENFQKNNQKAFEALSQLVK